LRFHQHSFSAATILPPDFSILRQQANFTVALLHLQYGKEYLDILASLIIVVLAICMLAITMQQPEQLMVYFEASGKDIVFTWRMRMVADVLQIIFLVSCGLLGEIMAIVTGVFLTMTFSLAQKRPDMFRELFRKHAGDPVVGDVAAAAEGSGYEEATEPSPAVTV
jgi:hypothetical protein